MKYIPRELFDEYILALSALRVALREYATRRITPRGILSYFSVIERLVQSWRSSK